jgi:transaldolase
VPQDTLDAFIDHGEARLSIEDELEGAEKQLDDLETVGLSLAQATSELEEEGVEKFGQSFAALLQTVEQRRVDAASG